MREDERAAHISSALGLRRTAHKWLRMAKKYGADTLTAKAYLSEAGRLLNYARWNLSMVRNIDARNGETND